MKKTNAGRGRGEKSAGQVEYGVSFDAGGSSASSSSSSAKKGGQQGEISAAPSGGTAVDWNRYCDSRLKQFCMR